VLYSVSEKTLIKRKKVYEKNARLCVKGTWSQGYLNMIMVGALNVGRIIVRAGKQFSKGDELGYFNLGSTIVMLI
jgi:phosphatidylserine decarboxylase